MLWLRHSAVREGVLNGLPQPPVSPRPLRMVDGFVEGVLGEQFVDHGQGAGGSAVLFPRVRGRGTVSCVLLTTGQADVGTDVLAGFEQRDVGDEQPDQPFAFPHRRGRVVPERGQVAGQGADAVVCSVLSVALAADAGPVVVVLGVGELAERGGSSRLPGCRRRAGWRGRRRGSAAARRRRRAGRVPRGRRGAGRRRRPVRPVRR